MAVLEDPDNGDESDARVSKRSSADDLKAGGSSSTAGSRVLGSGVTSPAIRLKFYKYQSVLVRTVDIPGDTSESDQVTHRIAAMSVPDWDELQFSPIEETQPEPIRAQWPQPSVRYLDMERDEPGLFAVLKARAATYFRYPFAKHDSE